ncbi:GATA zinc finger domain-containing protein 14-like [Sitodiplosis mosellana]|uniref:GATA zinc finger domain-containing protein 14-like n=1 Tax=Sitodiplosis mosellana TaxID=263140 RepID=UPI0024439E3C|nr:GATA zinc finger domain-containing protein 14-like [Sitodiplosis mosellana]
MDYGCDVSNRYTGYLDSSDHGTSMNSAMNKNKRKTKKKRRPKNQKFVDENTDTEQLNQCPDIEQSNQNNSTEPLEQNTAFPVGIGDGVDNQKTFLTDGAPDVNRMNEPMQHETVPNTVDFQKSLPSCDSPMQSDKIHYDVKDTNESNTTMDDLNAQQTKWSVICFEEEKSLMASESQNDDRTQKAIHEPELIFHEQRFNYPTIYFYNSNFGNKNRRTVDWHDSGRRSRNDGSVNRNNEAVWSNRNKEVYRNNEVNRNHEVNRRNETNVEKKPKRRNQYQNRRQKHRLNESDDNNHQRSNGETRLDDEKQTDSHNGSNDRASQQTDEYINNDTSNRREYTNSQNRYNKFKNGMSERTFTRRRRPDFVRNV